MNYITDEVLEKLDEIEVLLRPHNYPPEDVIILNNKLNHIMDFIWLKQITEE
jgi:hypothetical protein